MMVIRFLGSSRLVSQSDIIGCLVLLLILPCASCKKSSSRKDEAPVASLRTVKQVVASEELIIHLGQALRLLADDFDKQWRSHSHASQLFSKKLRLRDVRQPLAVRASEALDDLNVTILDWAIERQPVPADGSAEMPIWSAWKSAVSEVTAARFFVIDGEFLAEGFDSFRTKVGFEGTAIGTNGLLMAIHAEQRVTWRQTEHGWRIVAWEQDSFQTKETSRRLFQDVLDLAIPNPTDRERTIVSRHHQILVDSYFGNKPARAPKEYTDSRFFPDSVNIHPALSVVDIDRDGWDDLYVCVRWGRNMLFRNLANGSFEEIASKLGLDIQGRSTSATFADFDNDADPDLVLGRSLERSQYFVNQNGRFVESSLTHVVGKLPFLVTSTSAADFNGDGLLDIHFSTYSPLDITSRIQGKSGSQSNWANDFLAPDEAAEVNRRFADGHEFLGQVGPPNVLFVNRGHGRFERAKETKQIVGYRNTFQATWSDIDNDGDSDLYVANDFAPDQLYRNDRSEGFIDISQASRTQRMGFGMGAAWGDYDNDGLFDLYVSNMYSKAGRRITSQVPGLDSRMMAGAEGNYLFRNLGAAEFERVSGLAEPALAVANAGWSWGGQFADFNNDGFLDIYVSSGFYTPPDDHGVGVDL